MSASPLPKAMLPLSTLTFETESDPMLISPVKVFKPSSLAVSVPVSVFMAHLSLSVASAFA
jgi:hypothetical protein